MGSQENNLQEVYKGLGITLNYLVGEKKDLFDALKKAKEPTKHAKIMNEIINQMIEHVTKDSKQAPRLPSREVPVGELPPAEEDSDRLLLEKLERLIETAKGDELDTKNVVFVNKIPSSLSLGENNGDNKHEDELP